ncbi:DUF2867 domain-containing protein [Rugamonas sp. CCM 8940]|uniref:DUF2867 domain-containing protein n=1 Tax=Rugamonas sp. CCM 8940 TaxID=2765359 RepID=UPI0018F2C83E|nr:DUF2867 domain-containing protein [Rugamonas sp. CCM 8940]MBJ7312652.1 DUF2867 domain-containing protein [Rugamonas sp. CCM 8940]
MPNTEWPIVAVALPADSRVTGIYHQPFLADAYSLRLPPGAISDPEQLARFIFAQQAPWIGRLMHLRDALVSIFGLKTTKQLSTVGDARVAFFKIYERRAHEIILGEDDKHLDFRLSILRRDEAGASQVVMSTVVHCHNLLGRSYIRLIAPFHRMVVRSNLRQAALAGWPQQSDDTPAAN